MPTPSRRVTEIDGRVVGFVMGTLYMGEFGIFEEQASLELGEPVVDPAMLFGRQDAAA